MKKIASALIVTLGVLQGCGGGGGGGSSGGTNPPPQATSYSLSASVSGLEGSVTLVANSGAPVTISSNASTLLARLPAGTSYTVSIASQPTLRYCTLGSASGTLTADTTIEVNCVPRIKAQKETVGAFEVARFDVTALDLEKDEYSGSIDGSIGVTLAAVDGGLVLLMPPLSDGAHQLEVLVDNVRYPIDLNVTTPPLPRPASQIANDFLSSVESDLAGLRADPTFSSMSNWTAIDAEIARLKNELATMSAADLDALARILWMNEPTATATASAYSLPMRKFNSPICRDIHSRTVGHLLGSFAYLSTITAIVAIGVEAGPYGALIGAAGAMALYKLKAWPEMKALWAALGEYRGQNCFSFERLNFDLQVEERLTRNKPSNARLMATAQETLTFNHKRTREYELTGTGTLPEDIRESASLASKLIEYASALLSDEMKAFLESWTATYTRPVDVSDLTLSNVSHASIKGTLSTRDGKLRLRFEYLPNQMPDAPVDFTFTLSGNNQSWEIPARLNVLDPPIALDDEISTQTNEAFRGELKSEFAESFRITVQPVNGTVTLDESSGAYEYTPNLEFTGSDSFRFVAENERGESQPATVSIKVEGLCDLEYHPLTGGTLIERTCYSDMARTKIDFIETLQDQPPYLGVTYRKVVQVIPDDPDSIRTAEQHLYDIGDNTLRLSVEKFEWTVMPESSLIVERRYETANNQYAAGVPTFISWSRNTRNVASLTGTMEWLICESGQYTRVSTSVDLDPATGALIPRNAPPGEYNVEGACPKTAEETYSFLTPIPLEDIRLWQIWNASP